MHLIHAKVCGGMVLFHFERFVFAQVGMSSKVSLVIYI